MPNLHIAVAEHDLTIDLAVDTDEDAAKVLELVHRKFRDEGGFFMQTTWKDPAGEADRAGAVWIPRSAHVMVTFDGAVLPASAQDRVFRG